MCVCVCVRVWEGEEGGAKDGDALKRGESKGKYTVGPVALFVVGRRHDIDDDGDGDNDETGSRS